MSIVVSKEDPRESPNFSLDGPLQAVYNTGLFDSYLLGVYQKWRTAVAPSTTVVCTVCNLYLFFCFPRSRRKIQYVECGWGPANYVTMVDRNRIEQSYVKFLDSLMYLILIYGFTRLINEWEWQLYRRQNKNKNTNHCYRRDKSF